jgi:stage V sporulation protein D (sporulation-specific penicillin-binding protein)
MASFGQTFTITPIQLITAVSACVNGGKLMQPYLVKGITDAHGQTVMERNATVLRQVISEETSATVREILEQVVGDSTEGTGRNAAVSGYRIGGKTGTSENVVMIAQTGQKEYIVSFIGFAPADDPQIAILVLLDSPSNESGIYISGGQMAAPTVGNMFRDILPYLGVAKNEQ